MCFFCLDAAGEGCSACETKMCDSTGILPTYFYTSINLFREESKFLLFHMVIIAVVNCIYLVC